MPDRPKDTGRRILFSAQKNEGPFLLEWIAYHKVVGFTDIIIFSNDCTDGSDDMLDALARAGEIQHFSHAPETGQSPQLRAAEIAMESGLFRFGDWVMWLDSDEYLFLNVGKGTIPEFLVSIGDVDGFGFCWSLYGDGGLKNWPGRQISPELVTCARRVFPANTTIKSIFRFTDKIESLHLHRPIYRQGVTEAQVKFAFGNNELFKENFFTKRFSDNSPLARIPGSQKRYRFGQVNHYAVRTWDVYQERKLRGNGFYGVGAQDDRYTDAHFERFNRNERKDDRILMHLPALNAEIIRLSALVQSAQ